MRADIELLPGKLSMELRDNKKKMMPPPPSDHALGENFYVLDAKSDHKEISQYTSQRMSVVVFVGGCTWDQIAGVRRVAAARDPPVQLMIITTGIVGANHGGILETMQVQWE